MITAINAALFMALVPYVSIFSTFTGLIIVLA